MDYKRIFEHRKYIVNYRQRRRDVIGAIALAFELDCHFIFVQTDSILLIGKISALRPKAYVIVFTNKIEVKAATTIRFGVYCYFKDEFKDSTDFLKRRGFKYGCNDKDPITIL
jgi:pyruvate kinase